MISLNSELDSTARLWSNYKTDYAPLVDFAKENDLQFVATNIPRRYASLVYMNRFDFGHPYLRRKSLDGTIANGF
ncbi:MAG: ChaN family lipoprotein [Saprospiraceae bacterium]